jgi:dTDP-4-dehydrorhamnose reductase
VRFLITGAGGQLGRSLQAVLAGRDVIALSHAQLDVTRAHDVEAALAAHRPDVVFNASAYNAVDQAECEREAAFLLNEAGPRNLARACKRHAATLLHVSTDYVFDGRTGRPYDETAPPNPLSVYGASKLAGEQAVREENPRHYVVRTAWLYHERGRNFPLGMLERARQGPLRVVDDQRGSPTYAPHLAAALLRLLDSEAFGLWHLAGSGDASWYELAVALMRRCGLDVEVTPVTTAAFPRPAQRPAYSVLASTRQPRIVLPPWPEGLDAFATALGFGAR